MENTIFFSFKNLYVHESGCLIKKCLRCLKIGISDKMCSYFYAAGEGVELYVSWAREKVAP